MKLFSTGRFRQLDRRIQALSTREWWAMLIVGLLLIIAASQQFIGRSLEADNGDLVNRLALANSQMTALQEAEKAYSDGTHSALSPAKNLSLDSLLEQQALLEQRIDQSKERLMLLADQMIPAEQMPAVLDQLLAATEQVSLHKLSNTGGQQLLTVDQAATLQRNLTDGLYQHVLELRLGGNFKQLSNTLRQLQGLNSAWKVTSLHYQVEKYPAAEMTLGIRVLVNAADWLGI